MKNPEGKKQSRFGAAAAVLLLAAVSVGLFFLWRSTLPRQVKGSRQITLEMSYDRVDRSVVLRTEQTLLGHVLRESGLVSGREGPYGLYVLTVDGRTADSAADEWWKVTKNGAMLNMGVDAAPISDGEHYELSLVNGFG